MLYLIRSFRRGGTILKLGFTDNFERRRNSYSSHSPGTEFLSTREGDEEMERLFHLYLKAKGLQFKQPGNYWKEWFLDDPEIYQIFHYSREKLEKLIWLSRDKVFSKDDLDPGTSSRKLFDRLYERFKYSFRPNRIKTYKDGSVRETKALEIDIEYNRVLVRSAQIRGVPEEMTERQEKYLGLVTDFLRNRFLKEGFFKGRMRLYCSFIDGFDPGKCRQEIQDLILYKIQDDRFKKYYNFFGTPGCSARRYEEKNLYLGMVSASKETELEESVRSKFKLNEAYTLKEIKSTLNKIHQDLGIQAKAKATDLRKYFRLERAHHFTDPGTKKRLEGFRLRSLDTPT